jgi:hypothetical protein
MQAEDSVVINLGSASMNLVSMTVLVFPIGRSPVVAENSKALVEGFFCHLGLMMQTPGLCGPTMTA